MALSMFVLVPHNCLILDEPSNHLDVGTVEVSTETLSYRGTSLITTPPPQDPTVALCLTPL